MRSRTLIGGLLAVALAVTVAVGAPAVAQQYYGDDDGDGSACTGSGMMGGYGPGWMGPGMMGWGGGSGPGWMGRMMGRGGGYGPSCMGSEMMYGYGPGRHGWNGAQQGNLNLSVDQVKSRFEHWLDFRSNSHLKLGTVTAKDDDTITADIVTIDNGGLVQRYDINRHTGSMRPEG
jgi:hypothetical protein